MAVHAKRQWAIALLALLVAGGIACAPAHTAWARQDSRPAVANDPGDGVLGDPGDGLDGDPTDGEDAVPTGGSGGAVRAGDSRTAGDRGDSHEGSLGAGLRFEMVRSLVEIVAMMAW